MTTQEMSNEFDVLYNNITSNQAPGLDEYEKSVFLTKAQRQLVTEYFNNRTDVAGGGFDGSQKRQYDFSELIRTAKLFNVNTFKERISPDEKFDRRSKVFLFPQNYFLAVNELVSDYQYQYSVIPLDYAEYQRLMFKPYNLPVKRGAWRIITDKKNCNYCEEFVKKIINDFDNQDPTDDLTENTTVNYVILSSWADQKRNLKVTITRDTWNVAYTTDTFRFGTGSISPEDNKRDMFFKTSDNAQVRVYADCGWSDDKLTYEIDIQVFVEPGLDTDDETTIRVLQEGFMQLRQYALQHPTEVYPYFRVEEGEELIKAMNHIDGFAMCSAPSKFENFWEGKEFITKCIKLPMVEIIGKFQSEPEYKLRYVRTLKPIILANLDNYGDNLTIDGVSQETNCELPEEAHQEIVERAVTLAKIAWQGATATQVAAQQQQQRDRDNR